MRLLLTLFFVLGSFSAWSANTDYRAFLTNWFTTNNFYIGINTNPGSSTYQFTTNLIQNSASPQVWTNDGKIYPSAFTNAPVRIGDAATLLYANQALFVASKQSGSNSSARPFLFDATSDPGFTYESDLQFDTHLADANTSGQLSWYAQDANLSTAVTITANSATNRSDAFVDYTDGLGTRFRVLQSGDLSVIKTVGYSWPRTNALPGQVWASDGGTPQQLYWTNLSSGGVTNGSSSFWSTNISGTNATFISIITSNLNATNIFVQNLYPTNLNGVPLTNFILSGITNNNGVFGTGKTNYYAKWTPNTNTLGFGIGYEVSTNQVWFDDSNTSRSNNVFLTVVGKRTDSSGNWNGIALVAPQDNNDYARVESTNGPSVSGTNLMLLNHSWVVGAMFPFGGQYQRDLVPYEDNLPNIGTTSSRVNGIRMGTGQFIVTGSPSQHPNFVNNSWGIDLTTSAIDFYRNVAASTVKSSSFGTVDPGGDLGWDFGANALGFGGGVGSDFSFIVQPASQTAGDIQINTNNTSKATGPNSGIVGSTGTGSNHGGGSVMVKGGYGSGTARNGDVGIATAPSTASSGSTANNSYITNFYISSQPVTLTESSATLFCNVSVPSGKVVGFTVDVTVEANDGTDFQSDHQVFAVSCVNKGGTVTTAISASVPSANAVSAGTLTATYTAVANGNGCDLKCNSVSSLTQTTLRILGGYQIHLQGSGQSVITPQ